MSPLMALLVALLVCAALLSGCGNQTDQVVNHAAPTPAETMVAYVSYNGGAWGLHGRGDASAWHTDTDAVRDMLVVGGRALPRDGGNHASRGQRGGRATPERRRSTLAHADTTGLGLPRRR